MFETINVNKYTFFDVSVFIKKNKREKMCNQYEPHKVYFYFACFVFSTMSRFSYYFSLKVIS